MGLLSVYRDIEHERSKQRQFAENSARHAYDYVTMRSQGWGEMILPTMVEFKTTFVGEPNVASGHVIEVPPNPDISGLPMVSNGIYRWSRNLRGFYIGAFVYIRIDITSDQPESLMNMVIHHHFTFSGLSYKRTDTAVDELSNDPYVESVLLSTSS